MNMMGKGFKNLEQADTIEVPSEIITEDKKGKK
jgi:hypothetical protein